MNIRKIQQELATRLHRACGQVYETPVSGQPELPCIIIGFPVVENFHNDFGHSITSMRLDVEVLVGRGDGEDAMRQLADLISTDNEASVPSVLEDGGKAESWRRLTCISTTQPRDEGDAVSLLVTIEIDA